jgi:transcription-repair coupling factor (superfamily II helicase)
VKQKEKFKEMRSSLDVLSLSATPIPRTLYMALSSLKKMSIIQTPPHGRLPVKTIIAKRKEPLIKEAIEKELARKGQVYYLHNRVGTIELIKRSLEKLMPKASFATAHGRMQEGKLIKVIEDFKNKKFDVLLATTIIENGLDLANVSTIIIDDATKLGLAQAYQIKGRVGRSNTQSYAYFLHGGRLAGKAKLRLQALKEAEELGSGYRVAMRDLEIRGAGNILGREQTGTVNTIGLNLYCQMLSETVEKLKTVVQ